MAEATVKSISYKPFVITLTCASIVHTFIL